MAHVFDTGASAPQRTLVREGAVNLLSKLKRSNGGYLHDVKEFGGVVRSYTDEVDIEALQKALGPTPSIGVALASRSFETLAIGRTQAKSELQVLLYFANQHGRDGLTGRHKADSIALVDVHADPGLDMMFEHAIELMHGSLPATTTTIKRLQIKMEQELVTLSTVTIWVQTYEVILQSYTGSREFRTPEQIIQSLHWRTTIDPNEANRPAPAVSPTTIDADSDP